MMEDSTLIVLPRVYAIVDTVTLQRRGADPVICAEAMLDAGIRLLQFRHKGLYTRSAFQQATRIGLLCAQHNATYIIDDRADIASILSAGVHLGQDDLPPSGVRSIMGPRALIGYSTHNASQLAAGDREPVDYLAIGPVFATSSKLNPDPVLGYDTVAALRGLTRKPLVAIGGITLKNGRDLWKAGIDSVAVIGALLPDPLNPFSLRTRIHEWVQAANDML